MEAISPMKKPKCKNVMPLFSTKYTNEELQAIINVMSSFNINDEVPNYVEEENSKKCLEFMGTDNKISLTNA